MITLGGPGGYKGFDNGDTISFNIDEIYLVENTLVGASTDIEKAKLLETNITNIPLPPEYQVIRNGAYVTILKTA